MCKFFIRLMKCYLLRWKELRLRQLEITRFWDDFAFGIQSCEREITDEWECIWEVPKDDEHKQHRKRRPFHSLGRPIQIVTSFGAILKWACWNITELAIKDNRTQRKLKSCRRFLCDPSNVFLNFLTFPFTLYRY